MDMDLHGVNEGYDRMKECLGGVAFGLDEQGV
jgi:hypothetical protein